MCPNMLFSLQARRLDAVRMEGVKDLPSYTRAEVRNLLWLFCIEFT